MMVVLGIDVHKATHKAVAVDEVGRQVATKTVPVTDAGHRQLLAWALQQWAGGELRFAVEDCRAVATRLERALLAAGQTVLRVPPHLMAARGSQPAPEVSPIRSTHWRSPELSPVSRTCPPRTTTVRRATSNCWSITGSK